MVKMTPLRAIRKKCLECSGGVSKEVDACEHVDCPLFSYRLGKDPDEHAGARRADAVARQATVPVPPAGQELIPPSPPSTQPLPAPARPASPEPASAQPIPAQEPEPSPAQPKPAPAPHRPASPTVTQPAAARPAPPHPEPPASATAPNSAKPQNQDAERDSRKPSPKRGDQYRLF